MKSVIENGKLNVLALVLGLATIASSSEVLAIAPDGWHATLLAIGTAVTALSGVFSPSPLARSGRDKPFSPSQVGP